MNEWEWQLLEDKNRVDVMQIGGAEVRTGSKVRLHPLPGGDVFDLALTGQVATIEAIEQDYESKLHVCVVIDDDPGRDMGFLRQPGHRFFFTPEEIEPLSAEESRQHETVRKANILVAGIGNIFHGDDGFGVEVAKRLAARELPTGVRVVDFGIRGYDLAFALQDGYETTLLIDACPRGEAPGTLYVLEPDLNSLDTQDSQTSLDAHSMNPVNVLRMAHGMSNQPLKHVLIVGCEPESLGGEEGHMGLTGPVEAAVEEAILLVESLINKLIENKSLAPSE
jgi:hydrogenase maturation protease